MAEHHQPNAELEALRTFAAFVRDLVLVRADRSSSLAASLYIVVEEVENRINTVATNGVRWGTRSALVAILSHFPELEPELELLESGRDVDQSNDQADALWPLVSVVSDSLVLLIPSSLARDSPDDAE
jgi:hypothetical protein